MLAPHAIVTAAPVPALPSRVLRLGRRLVGCALLAGLYYASARLGYALRFSGPVAAIVWLPVGVGIAALYLRGPGLWPGVILGDLLANDYGAMPIGSAIGQTCGNLLEVLVAAMLVRSLVRRASPLDSAAGVTRMVFALALGTAISATVGGVSLLLGGVVPLGSVPQVWRTWWLGDFSGALLVVPIVLAWQPHAASGPRPRRTLELVTMLAVVAGVSLVAFYDQQPVVYVVFPVLIWAALRLGQRGTTLALGTTASIAIWETTHALGPFHFQSITRSVLSVQLYIAVAALSGLFLAAVVTERERAVSGLGAAQARALTAASVERQRLERKLHDGVQNRLVALELLVRRASIRRHEPGGLLERIDAELGSVNMELRTVAQGLHPLVLLTLGFANAVRSLAARSAIPVVVVELPDGPVDASLEEAAYLTIAEAVTNAQKHSGAAAIRIAVRRTAAGLELEITDDGIGGAVEDGSSGLRGLRDRVESLGGTFALDSPPGHGTRVAAMLPLADEARVAVAS